MIGLMVFGAFSHQMSLDQDTSNKVAHSENHNIHVGEDQYSVSATAKSKKLVSNQINNIREIMSNNGMSEKVTS